MRSTSTGMEYSGTVVALTPGDSSTTDPDPLAPGDEVLISGLYAGPRSYGEYQKYGGFATFSVAPRAAVTRVPAQLTMAQAATLNGAYETAYHALVRETYLLNCYYFMYRIIPSKGSLRRSEEGRDSAGARSHGRHGPGRRAAVLRAGRGHRDLGRGGQ